MKNFGHWALMGVLLMLLGCGEEPEPVLIEPVLVEPVGTTGFEHPTPVHVGDEPSRLRNRLTIDQLNASIRQVTGGIGWTRGGVDQFEVLASTMGVPDYAVSTQEDLETSALFQKFLGDAARFVCAELSDQAATGGGAGDVLLGDVAPTDDLSTNPEGVTANLVRLILRFHGQQFTSDSPEVQRWKWLFESSHAISGEPMEAWSLVCVALITHPDFYTY